MTQPIHPMLGVPTAAIYETRFGPVRISEREASILGLWEEFQRGRVVLLEAASASLSAKAAAISAAIERVAKYKYDSPAQRDLASKAGKE